MNHLYTFKGKMLVLSFAGLAFCCALTGVVMLLAGTQDDMAKKNDSDPIPVILLSDGKDKKIMAVEDFFKTVSSNPNLSSDDIAKIVKLKNEIDLGKAQIDLLKKLTEKKEDNFLKGVIRDGGNGVLNLIKYFTRSAASFASTCVMIGGVSCIVLWFYGRTDIIYSAYSLLPYILSWIPKSIPPSPIATQKQIAQNSTFLSRHSDGSVSYDENLQCSSANEWFYNTFFRPAQCRPLSEYR